MRTSRQRSRSWIGVGIGAAILLGAVWLAGAVWPLLQPPAPGTVQMADAPTALPEAPVVATEEVIVITPPPEGEPIALPTTLPGQIVVVGYPTNTPMPTFTPVPTPTQIPGLAVESYPTLTIPKSAEGQLLYKLAQSQEWYTLSVGPDARSVGEPGRLNVPLEGTVYKIVPSPNGKYTLLLQQNMPGGIPYVYDNTTQEIRPLLLEHPELPGNFYGWHPNGRQVLFWSLDVALWLVDVESGQAIPLAVFDGPMQGAAMSPDGQYVIYIARGEDTAHESMWKVSVAGSDARALFDPPSGGHVFGWSSDGRYILYMGGPPSGTDSEKWDPNAGGGLWLTDPEGKTFRPLAAPFLGGFGLSPVWSPDGQWVAVEGYTGAEFACQKASGLQAPDCLFQGGVGIYLENVETQELLQIDDGLLPTWSPDGSRLLYQSRQDGTITFWVRNIAAKEATSSPLFVAEQPSYNLVWTPSNP